MRRWLTAAVLGYFLYGLFIYWYLFLSSDGSLPQYLEGTPADPKTFLTGRELLLSEEYSRKKDFLFFLTAPFEWFIYLVLLITGLSGKFQKWAEGTARYFIVRVAVFWFWVSLLTAALSLPVHYIGYGLAKEYHISTQPFSSWMKDQLIDFWIGYAIMTLLAAVLVFLIRKYKRRWWLAAWILSIPFSLFLMFLQPVLLDPLYNDFYPLKDKELEAKILQIAERADIPAEHVYEVNMSEKTSSMNAYVTGIGSNSRIVLWDTTLQKLKENEILFIMAHEMGHYVMKHIYVGIAGYLLLSLAGLFLVKQLMEWLISFRGKRLQLDSPGQLAALPLFFLLIGVLSFASSPLTNAVSRMQEKSADMYAIEMTGDKEAAVRTFQELAKSGLSRVNPPELVKQFRYAHPTMAERIMYMDGWTVPEEE
ncbi:M48 family metalloprotease [Bacillus mangrovi]|uniref:M48 family metalloprotease n=1 Tax=Metabacillus mangrovi TaxID=1491830 RepID=A0A7X2S477_9BACI|nr:M48 family metallopeptidase [Metabacillus mangrovi]MTH53342.1 M48 family metalloprotease [Metabacillus mangrovi]